MASRLCAWAILLPVLLATGCSEGTEPSPSATPNIVDGLGDFDRGDDMDPVEAKSLDRQVKELTRDCMVANGFEYTVIVAEEPATPEPEPSIATLADAQENGFGISTWLTMDPDELLATYLAEKELAAAQSEDANSLYVAALSESEAAAYQTTLYGVEGDFTESTWGGGCHGRALQEIHGDSPPPALDASVGQLYDDLQEEYLADPRYIALTARYGECMRENGFSFQSNSEVYDQGQAEIRARLVEIVGEEAATHPDPLEGMTPAEAEEFQLTASDEEMAARTVAVWKSHPLPPHDAAALASLQHEEIALAMAHVDCTNADTEDFAALRVTIEAEFIKEHESEFLALQEARAD